MIEPTGFHCWSKMFRGQYALQYVQQYAEEYLGIVMTRISPASCFRLPACGLLRRRATRAYPAAQNRDLYAWSEPCAQECSGARFASAIAAVGELATARLLSIAETCDLQRLNTLAYLAAAIAWHPGGNQSPRCYPDKHPTELLHKMRLNPPLRPVRNRGLTPKIVAEGGGVSEATLDSRRL